MSAKKRRRRGRQRNYSPPLPSERNWTGDFVVVGTSAFYLLLVLAVNSSVVDLVSSTSPARGIEALDGASKAISSIALGVPLTVLVLRLTGLHRRRGVVHIVATAAIFIAIAGSAVQLQRSFVDGLVGSTTSDQRRAALGAVVAMHALSNGALTISSIGLENGIDRSDARSKVLAVYAIPYLAMTGRIDGMLAATAQHVERSVYRNSQTHQDALVSRFDALCEESKAAHSKYIEKSREIEKLGIFRQVGEKKFSAYRDDELGYNGTLPIGLSRYSFYRHTDIQYIIRAKFADIIDDYMSPYLEVILPKKNVKLKVMQYFNRKYIEPCLNWDSYTKEHAFPLGGQLGKNISAAVLDGDWSAIPIDDALNAIGEKAVFAVVAPPIAVFTTLISAILAITTIIIRVIGIFPALVFVIAATFVPMHTHNKYLENSNIKEGFELIAEQRGQGLATAMEWSMRAAPIIHPYGYYSRKYGTGQIFGLQVID